MKLRAAMISAVGATLFLSLAACGASTPAPEAPADGSEEGSEMTSEGEAPSTLELARGVAEAASKTLDSARSAEAELVLTLRIRVEGKVSALQINGVDANVLEGLEAAEGADVTLDLTPDLAQAVIDGEKTLAQAAADGKSDNDDALDRFLSFLTASPSEDASEEPADDAASATDSGEEAPAE